MPDPGRPEVVGYVDASFRKGVAGAGYVARTGGSVVLGCRPLEGMAGSNESEARAILAFVERFTHRGPLPSRIEVLTDSMLSVRSAALGVHGDFDDIVAAHDLCHVGGVRLSVGHRKGHVPQGSASGFLNHCADRLAALGAAGETLEFEVAFDAFWRIRVMGCHETLLSHGFGLSRAEAAEYLGVDRDTVDALLRHGHLAHVPGSPLLGARTLVEVKAQALTRGIPDTSRDEPLRPARGRVDEAGSGFGRGAPARQAVQAVVHLRQEGETVGAVMSLEGREGDEIFATAFPGTDGPAWEPVLEGLLRLVDDRYPGCDHLAVVTPDAGLVECLNGEGPWQGLDVVSAIDGRLARSEMTFEARAVPSHWKSWHVTFPAGMIALAAAGRLDGAWTVARPYEQGMPILGRNAYRPPWAGTGAVAGA